MQKRHHAPQRGQRIVHIVDRSCGKRGGRCGKKSRLGDSEPDFLSLVGAHTLIQSDACQNGVPCLLCCIANGDTDQENNCHCCKYRSALTAENSFFTGSPVSVSNHMSKGNHTGSGQYHHGIQLCQIGNNRRILQWCGRVCP